MRIQRKLATKNHSNLFGGHRKCQIGLSVACSDFDVAAYYVMSCLRLDLRRVVVLESGF